MLMHLTKTVNKNTQLSGIVLDYKHKQVPLSVESCLGVYMHRPGSFTETCFTTRCQFRKFKTGFIDSHELPDKLLNSILSADLYLGYYIGQHWYNSIEMLLKHVLMSCKHLFKYGQSVTWSWICHLTLHQLIFCLEDNHFCIFLV